MRLTIHRNCDEASYPLIQAQVLEEATKHFAPYPVYLFEESQESPEDALTPDLILYKATYTIDKSEAPPTEPPPNPSLNSINPNTAAQNAGTVTFNATGTRFYEGSKISFGGTAIPTQFVNTGKLVGTINTPDYIVGTFLVHVDNQAGGLSISKNFSITATAKVDPAKKAGAQDYVLGKDPSKIEPKSEPGAHPSTKAPPPQSPKGIK